MVDGHRTREVDDRSLRRAARGIFGDRHEPQLRSDVDDGSAAGLAEVRDRSPLGSGIHRGQYTGDIDGEDSLPFVERHVGDRPQPARPVQLTAMSSPPRAAAASAAPCRTTSALDTSAAAAVSRPAWSSCWPLRSSPATWAPSFLKRRAVAAPIPEAASVIRTRLAPSRLARWPACGSSPSSRLSRPRRAATYRDGGQASWRPVSSVSAVVRRTIPVA